MIFHVLLHVFYTWNLFGLENISSHFLGWSVRARSFSAKISYLSFDKYLQRGFLVKKKPDQLFSTTFTFLGVFIASVSLFERGNIDRMLEVIIQCTVTRESVMDTIPFYYFEKLLALSNTGKDHLKERLNFITSSTPSIIKSDCVVVWSCTQEIYTPRYFFQADRDRIELSPNTPFINEKIVYEILFGIDITEDEIVENIFALVSFFSQLKMFDYLFGLLVSIKKITLQNKLKLFNLCISEYTEKASVDCSVSQLDDIIENGKPPPITNTTFKSCLSHQLFLLLQHNLKELEENASWIFVLQNRGYWNSLQRQQKISDILEHPTFKYQSNMNLKNVNVKELNATTVFKDYFVNVTVSKLYHSRKSFNCTIVSNDDCRIEKVHKEILMLRSEFFNRMITSLLSIELNENFS